MICFVAYLVTTTYSYLSIQEQCQAIGSIKGIMIGIQSGYSEDTARIQWGYSQDTDS